MHAIDLIGCIASGLVLLTFYVNDMISLRTAALCSNVAFIIYAASLHSHPDQSVANDIGLVYERPLRDRRSTLEGSVAIGESRGAASRGTKEGQLAYGRNVGRSALFEVDAGSHEENVSKQQVEPRSYSIGTEWL